MTKKKRKSKNAAAWKKTAQMTPAQKRSYHAALRKIQKQNEKEAAKKAAAKKAAEPAAVKEAAAGEGAQAKGSGLRALLLYWQIFPATSSSCIVATPRQAVQASTVARSLETHLFLVSPEVFCA